MVTEKKVIKDLARSQLFTIHGEVIDQTVKMSNALTDQEADNRELADVIIDQKYKIVCRVGEGGMGVVFQAKQLTLNNRTVALKTFKSSKISVDSWKRFQREAQAIARLNHPNIVQILDFGVGQDNIPYYTMEFLSGQSLADRLAAAGPLPLEQTVQLFLQVCRGMSAAHSKGIIHRDLKPGNIFLTKSNSPESRDELVKLVDFGIADLAAGSLDQQKLTTPGTIFGSPLYMSPEQSTANQVTERSDIYSCGCALFETLTGRPPFRGENALATMIKHQQSPVPRLEDMAGGTKFPQRINALVTSMLAKKESDRFQSFEEVAAQLEAVARSTMPGLPTGKPEKEHSLDPAPPEANIGSTSARVSKTGKILIICGISLAAVITLIRVFEAGPSNHIKQPVETQNAGQADDQPTTKPAPVPSQAEPPLQSQAAPPLQRQAAAPDERRVVPQFCQNPEVDGSKVPRRFIFLKDKSLGDITWKCLVNGVLQKHPQPAIGQVTMPAGYPIFFEPGQALADDPALYKGFGPKDIYELELNESQVGDFNWGDKHLACLGNLTGLIGLSIGECCVTDECISSLNQLHNLSILAVGHGNGLTGSALTKLNRLRQLTRLTLEGNGSLTIMLQKLAGSRNIQYIQLAACHVTDDDLKLIATLPCLKTLKINGNRDITDSGIQSICHMPRLQELDLRGTNISPACIEYLKNMHSLINLTIEADSWPGEAIRRAKIALSHCEVKTGETNDIRLIKKEIQ